MKTNFASRYGTANSPHESPSPSSWGASCVVLARLEAVRLEVQHVPHGRPNGRIVLVRLAVLGQPAQPLPPEPACNTAMAVFATSPAPEAANDSAAAASARRSSAEGTVSDAAVNAACAERSNASDGPLGLLLPFVRFFSARNGLSKSAALGDFSERT